MLFIVDKTKTFFRKLRMLLYDGKKCQELIFAEDTYLNPFEPGFDQSILKIFVINADSLFAKYGKLTTR